MIVRRDVLSAYHRRLGKSEEVRTPIRPADALLHSGPARSLPSDEAGVQVGKDPSATSRTAQGFACPSGEP